jgi:hypothetical protein
MHLGFQDFHSLQNELSLVNAWPFKAYGSSKFKSPELSEQV